MGGLRVISRSQTVLTGPKYQSPDYTSARQSHLLLLCANSLQRYLVLLLPYRRMQGKSVPYNFLYLHKFYILYTSLSLDGEYQLLEFFEFLFRYKQSISYQGMCPFPHSCCNLYKPFFYPIMYAPFCFYTSFVMRISQC